MRGCGASNSMPYSRITSANVGTLNPQRSSKVGTAEPFVASSKAPLRSVKAPWQSEGTPSRRSALKGGGLVQSSHDVSGGGDIGGGVGGRKQRKPTALHVSGQMSCRKFACSLGDHHWTSKSCNARAKSCTCKPQTRSKVSPSEMFRAFKPPSQSPGVSNVARAAKGGGSVTSRHVSSISRSGGGIGG